MSSAEEWFLGGKPGVITSTEIVYMKRLCDAISQKLKETKLEEKDVDFILKCSKQMTKTMEKTNFFVQKGKVEKETTNG
jgi:NAD-specific glutamate dehydrogenase